MARSSRKRLDPRDISRRHAWVYIAVAVFVLVDIALIVLALNGTRPAPSGTPAPIPTYTPSPSGTSTPSPTPSATPSVSIDAVPSTRIIAAFDGSTAWRATTGPCPATPATAEITTDSGATWRQTDANASGTLSSLQRIIVGGKALASMVTLTRSDCSPALIKTFVAGRAYAPFPAELTGTWYVNPASRNSVHSPAGDRTAPCSVVALAVRDSTSAAVLCADHTVHATTDAAHTFTSSVAVPGATTIATSDAGYFAAATGQSGCAGLQIVTLTATLQSATAGCYATSLTPQSLAANVALASAGGTVWLWAGDAVSRSSDGGATWH